MSNEVKRYTPIAISRSTNALFSGVCTPAANGDYVKYEDYLTLEKMYNRLLTVYHDADTKRIVAEQIVGQLKEINYPMNIEDDVKTLRAMLFEGSTHMVRINPHELVALTRILSYLEKQTERDREIYDIHTSGYLGKVHGDRGET